MRNRSISSVVAVIALLMIAALLASCSLAAPAPSQQSGPIGPVSQSQPIGQQPPAQPMQLPSRRPNAGNGAALYAQWCVPCHGIQGRGDGQQAAQIQQQFGQPVADLTSDVIARAQTPTQWFDVVSNGRMSNGMPPFSAKLDANQVWDVIVYAWTLSATPAQIERGQAVYAAQCVQCHGDKGKGDGKDAQGKLSDLSDFATLANVEAGKWDQALASTHIPSFAGTLSTEEQRAAIDYIRTFAYDFSASAPVPNATPPLSAGTTAPSAGTSASNVPMTIQGQIINGTAGQPTPGNLPITFYIFPGGTGTTQITQTYRTDAQGRFTFTTTQVGANDALAVTTEYKQLNFFSDLHQPALTVTVPITVYENTADASNVRIETMHIVAITNTNGLDVSEIYVLSNTGDRMVAGFGQPIFHLALPAGASQFSLDPNSEPGAAEPSGDGVDFYAAVPVGTGTAQLVFQYTLPGSEVKLDRPIMQPVNSVNMLVGGDASKIAVTSDVLTSVGTQAIQGQSYQQYRGANLMPGQTLSVKISASAPIAGGGSSSNLPVIILGVLLIVGGVVGVFMWQRGRSQPAIVGNVDEQRDALIDQVAALDDDFAAGKIDEINYKAKRSRLKEKLLRLMSEE